MQSKMRNWLILALFMGQQVYAQNCPSGYEQRTVKCSGVMLQKCIPIGYTCDKCWNLDHPPCAGRTMGGGWFYNSYASAWMAGMKDKNDGDNSCPSYNDQEFTIYCDDPKMCSSSGSSNTSTGSSYHSSGSYSPSYSSGSVQGKPASTTGQESQQRARMAAMQQGLQDETQQLSNMIPADKNKTLEQSTQDFASATGNLVATIAANNEKKRASQQLAKQRATESLRQGALSGNVSDMYNLAMYSDLSAREELYWLRMAAGREYIYALNTLGHCFESGRLVAVNYDSAIYYYRRAADLNLSNAAMSLSKLLLKVNNPGLAFDYAQLAAVIDSGSRSWTKAQSCGDLAQLYEEGTGTPIDYCKALFWYNQELKILDRSRQRLDKHLRRHRKNVVHNVHRVEDKCTAPE